MKKRFAAMLLCALGSALAIAAPPPPQATAEPAHAYLSPSDLKWMPAPPVLPKGVQVAVLSGNPFAEGFSTVRLKIPPNTVFAPHWHPTAESFTVLTGKLFVGMGDSVDREHSKAMGAMGFVALPALHHHYVYTDGAGAVIDLSFYGPFQIHYVNPADDPSKQSVASP